MGHCQIDNNGHIKNVRIYPRFQGRKLGQRMMRELIVEARKLGFKTITLDVLVNNKRAQHIYYKLGFIFSSQEHFMGISKIWMKKNLQSSRFLKENRRYQ